MNRVPIIQRVPIMLESSDPAETAVEALSNIGDISYSPDMLVDAFTRQFASIWALRYKPIKNHPLTFTSTRSPYRNRPWQRQILDDTHPNKVVEKSRQLGLSELSITECIHFLVMHPHTNVMYTFPTYTQMNDFSTTRVSPVFRDSPQLGSLLSSEVNNITTKKIGDSYLFMRSSSSGSIGEGVDADAAYFDEYDRMREGVELAFEEGLSSSAYGLIRRFSTPTIPGRGINAVYQASDQMRYIHTCPHCGYKQFLTLDDNIIQVDPKGVDPVTHEVKDGTFIVGCKRCHKELDRWAEGEWVPMYPSIKQIRGYHISQLDATWISADNIMRRRYTYSSKQLFYNYVVGEPYASEGLLVTEEDIRASIRMPSKVMARNGNYVAIVAGIDWGDWSYMVILGVKSNGALDLLNMYKVQNDSHTPLRDVTAFCAILRAYQPNIVVADSGYGSDKNAYAYTQYPAQWYSCYWTTSKSADSKVRFKDIYNEQTHEITCDKTVKVQRTIYTLKNHLLGMFPWCEELQELSIHASNTRIMDDEDNGLVYSKATRIGPDHYISALSYALAGVDKITNFHVSFNTQMPFDFI